MTSLKKELCNCLHEMLIEFYKRDYVLHTFKEGSYDGSYDKLLYA